jgi:hypothetical protein
MGPFVQMGRGIGPACSVEQLVSSSTGRQRRCLFADFVREGCQSVLEWDGLFETTTALDHIAAPFLAESSDP